MFINPYWDAHPRVWHLMSEQIDAMIASLVYKYIYIHIRYIYIFIYLFIYLSLVTLCDLMVSEFLFLPSFEGVK